MSEQVLKKATDLVKRKDFDGALDMLRPLISQRDMQGPALYVMGYVHEKQGNLGRARYLYIQSLGSNPNQAVVLRRLEKFDKKYAGKKSEIDSVDVENDAHRSCWSCDLRYPNEDSTCPFCGAAVEEPPDSVRDEVIEDAAEMARNAKDQAGKLGRELLDKVSNWVDAEDIEKAKAKAVDLGKKGAEKAKAITDRDDVQHAAKRARELGEEAVTKAQHYVDDERDKYKKADEEGRKVLLLKWGAMLAVLMMLYLMFGPGGCI